MKSSVIYCVVLCACFVGSLHAAAVEPVVEELEKDAKPPVAAMPESELITNEDCHQPKETGRCFALFYRFAYDVEKRECVEFIYGGCAGNSNNFESKEECEIKCTKKPEESDAVATTVVPDNVESETSTAAPSDAVEESTSVSS